ncbi:MAG TPA: NAD(P)H-quinone oxidoreductase [Puia sp.]|nr:NAD(P)H-quinone oxidoreductase [Puia sp.]
MKAILITRTGGPEVLDIQQLPAPVPGPKEVLIRVTAAGLNRSDIYSRTSSSYGSKDNLAIPGLEVSGYIEACGPEVTRWKKGDPVCALVTGGGYAEYVTAPEGQCLPVPNGISMEEAAALPETVFTVWSNVFQTGRLQPGETLLVHGGSSGIGVTAIQMATALGSPVYATAGTNDKCRWCETLGAARCINYKLADFEAELKNIGMDVILDMTGGDFTAKNVRLLKEGGRMVFINAMRGKSGMIDIGEIMRKRLVLTGSMLKPRDTAFKSALAAEVEQHVWPLVAKGLIRPFIYKVFPLKEAAAAQALMESNEHVGKLLLRVDQAGGRKDLALSAPAQPQS